MLQAVVNDDAGTPSRWRKGPRDPGVCGSVVLGIIGAGVTAWGLFLLLGRRGDGT
jgi:hypothetical protein